jgi:2-desacetyl-2-hydroxyethyl bacteriochlorophyllide A dehydrogenase
MRAARFYGGKDIRVETVPDPAPGPGEALIGVRAAGICGSDLHGYRRAGAPGGPPRTPGHELAGVVLALGPGAVGFAVGQPVAVEPLVGCGACRFCRSGDYHLCPSLEHIGGARPGGFAEQTVAPVDRLYPLPDALSFDEASLLDVFAVAVHALTRVPVRPGERVAVIGTGAIGLSIAQAAAAAGGAVAVVGRREHPLQVAAQTAGALGVNSLQQDPLAAIQTWSQGEGADVVFEAVGGAGGTLDLALQLAAPHGRVGVVGSFQAPQMLDVRIGYRRELTLQWVWSYAHRGNRPEFAVALDMLARGQFQAAPLITHRYPLERIAEAFGVADDKAAAQAIKVLVIPFK